MHDRKGGKGGKACVNNSSVYYTLCMIERVVTHAIFNVFCSPYAIISVISYVPLLYHVNDLSTST